MLDNGMLSQASMNNPEAKSKEKKKDTPRVSRKGSSFGRSLKNIGLAWLAITALEHGGVSAYNHYSRNGRGERTNQIANDTRNQALIALGRACADNNRSVSEDISKFDFSAMGQSEDPSFKAKEVGILQRTQDIMISVLDRISEKRVVKVEPTDLRIHVGEHELKVGSSSEGFVTRYVNRQTCFLGKSVEDVKRFEKDVNEAAARETISDNRVGIQATLAYGSEK